MTITIDSNNPRSMRAVEIAGGAAHWVHVADDTYAIESQAQPGAHYLASPDHCTCPDAKHGKADACKHQLAVRLYLILSQAALAPVKQQAVRPLTREAHPELARILGKPRVLHTVRED